MFQHVLYELAGIFPEGTEAEKKLLCLLDKSYREARYSLDYEVREEELLMLFKRVEELHLGVIELMEEWLGELKRRSFKQIEVLPLFR